jgi:hypothetical protein
MIVQTPHFVMINMEKAMSRVKILISILIYSTSIYPNENRKKLVVFSSIIQGLWKSPCIGLKFSGKGNSSSFKSFVRIRKNKILFLTKTHDDINCKNVSGIIENELKIEQTKLNIKPIDDAKFLYSSSQVIYKTLEENSKEWTSVAIKMDLVLNPEMVIKILKTNKIKRIRVITENHEFDGFYFK